MANPIKIKKGLNLPITGEPEQEIKGTPAVTKVAIVASDYIGMKPTMHVKVGEKVKKGQILFADKKHPSINYTAPGAGEIVEINRGAKRVFQSIVIALDEKEEELTFKSYSEEKLKDVQNEQIKKVLIKSGAWTSLRVRPYSKVANPDTTPHSIFVTAIDTNPLAASVAVVMKENEDDFADGLKVLTKLTDKVFLCTSVDSSFAGKDIEKVVHQEFSGMHPAGNVGTHIHFLDPVGPNKIVWHINYQDVIMFGKLFTTGKLYTDRIISLAGPSIKNPRLLRTRIGASIADLTKDELKDGEVRIVSGSVLSGRHATGPFAYLGRFHNQISALNEGREREFLGWQSPGFNKFSVKNIYASKIFFGKKFNFTTTTNGSKRALIPIGSYEKVMPLDILPSLLLRSLLAEDTDKAQALGCLELDEEDLALCTFVCPGKIDFGPVLRQNLTNIEKDG